MTENEIDACQNEGKSCETGTQNTSYLTSIDDSSCAECPPGQCRFNDKCYCTKTFRDSQRRKDECGFMFNAKWPFPIGKMRLTDATALKKNQFVYRKTVAV